MDLPTDYCHVILLCPSLQPLPYPKLTFLTVVDILIEVTITNIASCG